jgi:hypothetical protein
MRVMEKLMPNIYLKIHGLTYRRGGGGRIGLLMDLQ